MENKELTFNDDLSIIGEDSSYFLCNCGAEFEKQPHYESHLRLKHQLNNIVASESNSSIIKKDQSLWRRLQVKARPIHCSQKQNFKDLNSRMGDKEEQMSLMDNLQKGESFNYDEIATTWQGFKLVKNKYCKMGGYYCGNCQIIFFKVDDYLSHCIKDCQTLLHQGSSHIITPKIAPALNEEIVQVTTLSKNTNIISNMQTKSSSYQAITGSNPKGRFHCGCSEQFTYREDFKEHSRRMHNHQYIQGSSHFITPITEVVLPINQHPLKQNQTQYTLNLKYFLENQKKCINHAKINDFPQSLQRKSIKPIAIKQALLKAQVRREEQPINQPLLTHPVTRQQQLEWNGFKLIKNDDCDAVSYYCGVCKVHFSLPEQYIVHCIEVCQSLHSPLSSHYITCTMDQQQNAANIQDQEAKPNKGTIRKLRQRKSTKIIANEVEDEMKQSPIKLMFLKKKEDHRNLPFYCGVCHESISNDLGYRVHISKIHSQIIDPSSSHIILRTLYSNKKRRGHLYISKDTDQKQLDELNYYCPCKPQQKMSISKLIKHIVNVHKGISPYYSYTPNVYKKLPPDIMTKENQNDEDLTTIQPPMTPKIINPDDLNVRSQLQVNIPICHINPILEIVLLQKLQKSLLSLECLTCSQKLSSRGNIAHINCHLHRGQKFDFSHVILRTKLKSQPSNGYIPMFEEWPNKEAVYYCPCAPRKKVTMRELVQHIINTHNYVSPLYVFR